MKCCWVQAVIFGFAQCSRYLRCHRNPGVACPGDSYGSIRRFPELETLSELEPTFRSGTKQLKSDSPSFESRNGPLMTVLTEISFLT
jgi:hypothetical protein